MVKIESMHSCDPFCPALLLNTLATAGHSPDGAKVEITLAQNTLLVITLVVFTLEMNTLVANTLEVTTLVVSTVVVVTLVLHCWG